MLPRLGAAVVLCAWACGVPSSEPPSTDASAGPVSIAEARPAGASGDVANPQMAPAQLCDLLIDAIKREPAAAGMTELEFLIDELHRECTEENELRRERDPESYAVWARCVRQETHMTEVNQCIEDDPEGHLRLRGEPPPNNDDPSIEARAKVDSMFGAAAAYFRAEHGGTQPHRCPNDGQAIGAVGPTPPLSVDCSAAPNGECRPAATPKGPGEYDAGLWQVTAWSQLGFQQTRGHRFHYAFRWANRPGNGYGTCQFTAQAFADLDGDGIFSTYERSGAADDHGINAAVGLYIDRAGE